MAGGAGLGVSGLGAVSWPMGWGSGWSRPVVGQQLGESRGHQVGLAGNSPPWQPAPCASLPSPPAVSAHGSGRTGQLGRQTDH